MSTLPPDFFDVLTGKACELLCGMRGVPRFSLGDALLVRLVTLFRRAGQ